MTNKKLLITLIAIFIIAFYSSSLLKLTGFTTSNIQCDDDIDNDNDQKIDYPADTGCFYLLDNSETCSSNSECSIDCPQVIGQDTPRCSSTGNCYCGSISGPAIECSLDSECSIIDCPQVIGQDTPRCSSTGTCYCGPKAQCSDTIDNDNDNFIDYPADLGCSSKTDDREITSCQDGKDNDNDGKIDYPTDPGCTSIHDGSEKSNIQCDDDIDNDNDQKIDYPADTGCLSLTDNSETCSSNSDCNIIDCPQVIGQDTPRCSSTGNCYCGSSGSKPQCSDGIDNDNDQKIDYPADTGCFSLIDDSEICGQHSECSIVCLQVIGADTPRCSSTGNCYCGSKQQCSDGVDNDGDGLIDYPADTGCFYLLDNSETCSSNSECSIDCTTSTKCSSTGDCYCESTLSKCGNGEIDKEELCDTNKLQGYDCDDFGFESGDLSCNNKCHFDTSQCIPTDNDHLSGYCGDGLINPGEECEPDNPDILNNFTCEDAGYSSSKSLECYSSGQSLSCFFDISDCGESSEAECGNNIIEEDEDCEGSDLDGQTCQTLNYDSGNLLCDADCKYDRTNCASTVSDEDCSWSCFAPSECSSSGQQTKICTFTGEEYSDSCLSLIDEEGSCSSSYSETKATLTCSCIPETEIPFFTLTSLILSIFLLISYYVYKIRTS